MADKEKLHQILSSLWKNDDSVGKTYYNQALQNVQTAIDLQEKPVSDDLEEAANFYANTHTEWFDADNNPHVSLAFKAGAKWQKEQMMAKAIDGIARPDDNEIWCNLTSNNLEDGDKIKVIVIKED